MPFDPAAYGPEVLAVLALDGSGARLMPLTRTACSSPPARAALKATTARALFPHSRAPEAALAGLYLYFSCWAEAHETAQDIASPEGAWWHAIVHRQEPDDWNSGYWFRQVGQHPIFSRLAANWDPIAFIELGSQARQQPGGDLVRQALNLQRTEWQLLFDYCAAR
jgi:hypothetical protein